VPTIIHCQSKHAAAVLRRQKVNGINLFTDFGQRTMANTESHQPIPSQAEAPIEQKCGYNYVGGYVARMRRPLSPVATG